MGTETSTITRRELLKKGALVGGTALWVTPVVQVVGMSRAFAKETSPGCIRYCLKWNVDDNLELGPSEFTCIGSNPPKWPKWSNNWVELGLGVANALTCPSDGSNTRTSADYITNFEGREFVVYSDQAAGFWIAFPNDVKLADLTDVNLESVGAKCGTTRVTFTPTVEPDPCLEDGDGNLYRRIHIPGCSGTSAAISHIELIVDVCPTTS